MMGDKQKKLPAALENTASRRTGQFNWTELILERHIDTARIYYYVAAPGGLLRSTCGRSRKYFKRNYEIETKRESGIICAIIPVYICLWNWLDN
jgi:hypothetical protein